MARPGKYEHLKPAVERLVREGLRFGGIKKQYPEIPNATLSAWVNAFKEKVRLESTEFGTDSESPPESIPAARVRLAKIDPESPLDKITRALWDVVDSPDQEGAGVKVQALNALFKIVQWNHGVAVEQDALEDVSTMDDAELEKIATNG
ncbi:hypothetical protein Lepto7375DRAFT_7368 [Leptolyngbya sp. PCC 7375]|nr:hypothetical protein Lepto7375DRAFT_7368 [Leptolyngbya sp. PCC 7375]